MEYQDTPNRKLAKQLEVQSMNKRYLITKFCSLVLLVLLTACGGPKFTTGTYMNEKIGHSRIIFTSDGEYTLSKTIC